MRVSLAALAVLLLAGCAQAPPKVPPQAPATRAPAALPVVSDVRLREVAESFELRGKMGASIDGSGYNARLAWLQQGPVFNITLSGPVGIGRADVLGHPGIAAVRQAGEERLFDRPADALSAAFGFAAPLSELRFWAVGSPAPGPGFTERPPPAGAVRLFEQSGWTVLVRELQDTAAGPLPRRVTLTRQTATTATRLRLVFSQWVSPSEATARLPAPQAKIPPPRR